MPDSVDIFRTGAASLAADWTADLEAAQPTSAASDVDEAMKFLRVTLFFMASV